MNPNDYTFLVHLLKNETGLALGPDKQYLFEQRLGPIAVERGLGDLEGLVRELRFSPPKDLVEAVGDAMTTNETLFFRDQKPFNCLRDEVLPALLEARRHSKRLRIWCAASSTGQEPYSIAMLLASHHPEIVADWAIEILATDISPTVLDIARRARYSHFEVQRGLPAPMLVRFFEQDGNDWLLKPEIKKMVTFKRLNLLHDWNLIGKYDIVMCRNVLIYFDDSTKSKILEGFSKVMNLDGYLFLGGAETLLGLSDRFEKAPMTGACYTPVRKIPASA